MFQRYECVTVAKHVNGTVKVTLNPVAVPARELQDELPLIDQDGGHSIRVIAPAVTDASDSEDVQFVVGHVYTVFVSEELDDTEYNRRFDLRGVEQRKKLRASTERGKYGNR